jgi:hypothetical protein
MKPVAILLGRGEEVREKDRGGKSNKIYCKHICKYHNVSSCTIIRLINFLKNEVIIDFLP